MKRKVFLSEILSREDKPPEVPTEFHVQSDNPFCALVRNIFELIELLISYIKFYFRFELVSRMRKSKISKDSLHPLRFGSTGFVFSSVNLITYTFLGHA